MAINSKYIAAAVAVIAIAGGIGYVASRHNPAPAPIPPAVTTPAPVAPPAPVAAVAPPADCQLPGPAPVPADGASASEDEMMLSHDAIQNFVQQLEDYQTCRNNQADHAAPGVSQQQKDTWINQGNSAVDQATALASAFSVQLKIFKARTPGS